MSITSEAIWAASPSTTRGQPTILSTDPKGERIAYASNKSIFIRDIDKPEVCRQYTEHTAQTSVARFSPSGYYVASGDVSGTVRVWDCVGEGATKGEYPIIAGRINDIAWDGDSQRILAAGAGKEIFGKFITWDSGNSVGEVSGQSSQINSVAMKQQRPFRAATGSDDTTLAFYHGAPFKFNTSLRGNHNKFVYGTAFSPDGSLLVSVGSDRRIWLFDGKTGEAKSQIGEGEHTGSIFGVSWSKDSKQFVTASADQTVRIWDAEAGKSTQTWRLGDEGVVSVPDQQVGVVWPAGRSDGLIISVDLEGRLNYLTQGNQTPSKIVHGHQRNITASAMSSKSSTFFTGSSDGHVRAWDVSSGSASVIDGQSHSNYVSSISSNDDGSRVSTVGWDDTMRSIDTSAKTFTGEAVKTSGQPKAAATTSDGRTLVATSASVDLIADGAEVGDLALSESTPTAVAASKDGFVAVGAEDQIVRVFKVTNGSKKFDPVSELREKLKGSITSLAFSSDGSNLAVGTSSGGICVFGSSDWSLVTSRWSSHTARITSLAWDESGEFAVSGSLDTNVHLWSLKEPGKRIKAGNAHKDGVNGVAWLDKGKVVSVGADAAVKVWKIEGL